MTAFFLSVTYVNPPRTYKGNEVKKQVESSLTSVNKPFFAIL